MPTLSCKQLLILAFVCFSFVGGSAVGQHIALNPGLDTSNKDVQAAVSLWTNYLKSKPDRDNVKSSPYWADQEKRKYPNVDQLLYAITSDAPTYITGNPTILYATPKNGFIEIKTLFGWSDSSQSVYVSCLTSVFTKNESGEYKLYNALTVNSKKWRIRKVGNILFHFPPTHTFDIRKANKLIESVNFLTKQWNLPKITIDYYYANTYDEVQNLRGLYYSVGMGNLNKPSGMADEQTNAVFAGGLGENYFHEVVHIYLNRLFPQSPFREGLAVFYGGSLGHDLKWHLKRLNTYLEHHPEVDLSDFDNFHYMDNFTNPYSATSGLICYLAFKNGGLAKLKKMMSYNDTYTALENEFGTKREKLNDFLRDNSSVGIKRPLSRY